MSTKFSLSASALILAGLGATVLAQNSNLPVAPVASLAVAESRAPDRTIHLGKLPTAAELTREAAARNVAVLRIEESARRVVVFYQNADGGVTSDAYELMSNASVPVAPSVPAAPTVPSAPVVPSVPVTIAPAAGAATAQVVPPAPAAATTTIVVPTSPAPRVVYYEYPAAPVYYSYPVYDTYPAYYYRYPNWGWYAPIGVNLSFGWRGGAWHGGGFRGGFRGGFGGGFRGGHR